MKIIEVDKLNAWIQANQRDEVASPPIPEPVTFPCDQCTLVFNSQAELDAHKAQAHPVTPPVGGKWTSVIASGFKCNVRNSYIGYGYHERGIPTAIQVAAGTVTYFIVDPFGDLGLNYSGRSLTFRAVDYDQSATGTDKDKSSRGRVIMADREGNELMVQNLSGENNQILTSIYITSLNYKNIFIIEHTQGDLRGGKISSWWP